MKTLIIALIATVAGGAVGIGMTYRELTRVGSEGLGSPVDTLKISLPTAREPSGARPKVEVVGGTSFEFGTMERGATMSHAFIFKNEGTRPLTLEKGETSCKCTLSDLASGELAPGQSTEVRLEWTPKEYEVEFSQSAEILTNDPLNRVVSLSVVGRVIQSVRPVPASVTVGSVPQNEATVTELKLFSYPDEPVEITDINWGTQSLAEYFSAEVEPLSSEELATDPDAKTGKLVKIHVKPGLPLGPINQKIRLTTNFPELPVLEVPLVMTVSGDISIVGRGYVADTSTLMLGRVRSSEGETVKLNLLVKGPHRDEVEFTVGEVVPGGVMQVTFGEKVALKNGALYRVPLEIVIPAGSRAVNHIGPRQNEQGKIVLETNHPDVKQLPIYVRFAVE